MANENNGFINQFPYADFHELNLDWLIKETKDLRVTMTELQEEFAKIVILTEDQINAMIAAAIEANNVELYAYLNDLKIQIKNDYESYCNAQITTLKNYTDGKLDNLTVYVDNQDVYYHDLATAYSDNVLVQAKAYTDDQVLNYTMMTNPITGEYDDVRNVVDDIVSYFHTENALTAGEYDALELTAEDYDNYEISAYDYDFNGKTILNP